MIDATDVKPWPYNLKSVMVEPNPHWRESARALPTATPDQLQHVSIISLKELAVSNLFNLLTPEAKQFVKDRLGIVDHADDNTHIPASFDIDKDRLIKQMQEMAYDPNLDIRVRAQLMMKLADIAVPKAKPIDTIKSKQLKTNFTIVTGVPDPTPDPTPDDGPYYDQFTGVPDEIVK